MSNTAILAVRPAGLWPAGAAACRQDACTTDQAGSLSYAPRTRSVTTLLLVLSTISSAFAAPPLEEVVEQTFQVGASATLSVRNTDGVIYIYGSDEGVIKITARKKAYSQERLKAIAIKASAQGDTVMIETGFPPRPGGLSLADRSGTVDYIILVPQSCTIAQAELANGEIIVEGLRGAATHARLTNGRMTARNCFSDLDLRVTNGGLDLVYDWWEPARFSGRSEINRGHITLGLPSTAAVEVDAVSARGTVKNEFADAAGGAKFELRAQNGNIVNGKGE